MGSFFASLGQLVLDAISQNGYLAIFSLMFLEAASIPFPSFVTMPFGGFLVTRGLLSFWPVVIIGGLGNLAGSLAAYALGFWGQEAWIKKIVQRYGRYLLLSYDDFQKGQNWFYQKGELIAFFGRLVPVVRAFISLPAGLAKVRLPQFIFYTLTGSLIWSYLMTYLGLKTGENWAGTYARQFSLIIVLGLAVLVGLYLHHKIKRLKKSA